MGTLIGWFERLSRQAARAAARAAQVAWRRIDRFVHLIFDIVYATLADRVEPPVAAMLTILFMGVLVTGLLAGGVAATLLIRDLAGGGESAQVVVTAPAVVAPTTAATPTAAPSLTATPAVDSNTITVRGTLDESRITGAGISLPVVENSITLELPRDGGPVKGSSVFAIDNFPIGAVLAGIHESMGGSLADYPDLQSCVTLVRFKADIEGSYSAQDSTITGQATFSADVEEKPCLGLLPPNMTASGAMTPSTRTLKATFDGRKVLGTFGGGTEDEQKFQATVQ
jgi:hypothetical protein